MNQNRHQTSLRFCNPTLFQDLCCGKPATPSNENEGKLKFLRHYKKPSFVRPYILITYIFFLYHFCGMSPLRAFAVKIFETVQAPINSYLATVLIGSAELTGASICFISVHYTGKRFLIILSTTGCAICFCVVATYVYLNGITDIYISKQVRTEVPSSWIPTVFLILGTLMSNIGTRIIPWVLMSEVFSKETRAAATGFTASTGYIFGFLVNIFFLKMVGQITFAGTFWFYSAVGLSGAIVLYFALPETEGKTLDEIEDHFAGVTKLDKKVARRNANGVENAAFDRGDENNRTVESSRL